MHIVVSKKPTINKEDLNKNYRLVSRIKFLSNYTERVVKFNYVLLTIYLYQQFAQFIPICYSDPVLSNSQPFDLRHFFIYIKLVCIWSCNLSSSDKSSERQRQYDTCTRSTTIEKLCIIGTCSNVGAYSYRTTQTHSASCELAEWRLNCL